MPRRTERRFGMAVDMVACVGCSACVIACRDENNVPDGCSRRWIEERVQGRFPDLTSEVYSESCQHCDYPPCVDCCPTGASHIDRPTGTTQVDRDKCTGCKACVAACPYDSRFVHPDGYVDKSTLCIHRLRKGEPTACEAICPTDAITVGDLDDPHAKISQLVRSRHVRQFKTDAGTRPRFFLLERI